MKQNRKSKVNVGNEEDRVSIHTSTEDAAGDSTENLPVETNVAEQTKIVGLVTNCLKLNIRSTPVNDTTGENIIATIDACTEVVIDEDASTDEFYKICTAFGVEGFCMKGYIAVQQ